MIRMAIFTASVIASASAAATVKYDKEMLASLGYDPSAAALFEAGAHFFPGENAVNISVNGKNKGVHRVIFDSAGSPCWNEALLRKLGIDSLSFDGYRPACLKPLASSKINIKEEVRRSRLQLQVPVSSLLREVQYATGGKAAIVNYDARHYQFQSRSGENHHSQSLTSEVGANISHWILRSGQSYSALDNQNTFTRLYSYGQRSVPAWASVIQVGEIISSDALFSGITLTGAQIVPERATQNGGMNLVSLNVLIPQTGSAEVWQGNVLLKTFTVTAGMNRLSRIPALNQQDDFVIIIRDESGNQQQQTFPVIQAMPETLLLDMGTSLALGQLRLTQEKYPLLLGSTGVFQHPRMAVGVGGLVSEAYQAGGWRASVRLSEYLLATLSQTWSLAHKGADSEGRKQGLNHQAGLIYPVTQRLSLTASMNTRSRNYVDTSSSWSSHKTAAETGQIKSQYAAGVSYSHEWLGVFSFTGSQARSWQGSDMLGYTQAWGRAFGKVNVNLGVQKNRLTSDRRHYDNRYAYLSFSLPLGENRSLRSWINSNDGRSQGGIGYDQSLNDKFAWSLSSEKNQRDDPSLAGSASWTSKYTQLSGGASRSDTSTSFNAGARGGAVLHSEGLTFTPRSVGDTFSVISLNNALPDVEMRTPAGAVWSDRGGYAISSWMPWQKNTVHINPTSLPKNVQVPGGIIDVLPYRGAVVPVTLPAFTVRRTLLSFPANEKPAPGSAVKDEKGLLLAFVNEDGTIFFDDLPDGRLYVQRSDGKRCVITLTSPWAAGPGALYASLSARCVT